MRLHHRTVFSFFIFCRLFVLPLEASEWRQLVRGQIVLHCYEEDLKNGERVMSIAHHALPRIVRDLNSPSIGEVTIVVAPSEKQFHALTGGQVPEWGVGAADPSRSLVFLKSPRFARPEANFKQIVVHELTHVVLGMALGGKEIDRWFDEGFAQYESGEKGIRGSILLARSLITGDILWLDEIDDVLTFRREKASLAYQEARAAVDYLVEIFGNDVIADIVQVLREGKGMDDALLAACGVGFQDFQTDWYLAMKHKYRWYILLDFPLVISTVLVILFLMAFFATRRRIRKKKHIWEKEDLYAFQKMEEHSTSN